MQLKDEHAGTISDALQNSRISLPVTGKILSLLRRILRAGPAIETVVDDLLDWVKEEGPVPTKAPGEAKGKKPV